MKKPFKAEIKKTKQKNNTAKSNYKSEKHKKAENT